MSVEQSVEYELAVLGENYPSVTSATTNPTWLDLGSNMGRSGGKPVTWSWVKKLVEYAIDHEETIQKTDA
jgi:hypothetical protein